MNKRRSKNKISYILNVWIIMCVSFPALSQSEGSFQKLNDGILVYPAIGMSEGAKAIRIIVINEKIIRITASPTTKITEKEELVVINTQGQDSWEVHENDDFIHLSTSQLITKVNKRTGSIGFYDKNGNKILTERNYNGRRISGVVLEGQPLYELEQTFESTPDDFYFGLGQHQDDEWNYMGKQVVLFQNNTEVGIPFLVSVKNYGILWDNYSYTKVGDTRPYQPLSSLMLFDKHNEQGWLTATYYNDRNDTNTILYEKAETDPDYPYLSDTKTKLPADFHIQNGMIEWEGGIASNADGEYTLRFSYGGYLKLRIDDQLVFDKWRQAWNPGTAIARVQMEKGIKHKVRIQWIPDGGESYYSAKVLSPIPAADLHTIKFLSEAGRDIDYYFVFGQDMDDVIHGYRELTGKAPIIPKWAMGFWQSRERYKTQDELLNVVAEFRKRKIPLDNIVQDWFYWKEDEWGSQEFDPARFPDPDNMIKTLHSTYKTHFMISVWPKFYEGINAYKQFDSKGWLYKRNIADRQKDWVGQGYISTFYDVFNPEARKGFWDLLNNKLYRKGIDAWWMDASEPDILSNVTPAKRKEQMSPNGLGTAAEFLNAYPLLNAKGIYEGQRNTDPGKRVFLLTRSAFAGSQRYAASVWSGDVASRWEDMRTQITAGLNYSMSGLPYWTMDIGGFAVERRYEQPDEKNLKEWRELQTRWYQWGSFLPLFRVHGQFPFREIYNIAPEGHPAYNSMLYYNKLRYRLLPYTYSLAGLSYHNDYTMLRGLVMDFAYDQKVISVSDQFLFGPSLMVCPVYTYGAEKRDVYLPSGQGWYDLYSGKYFEEGQRIKADAPYERVPVFIKAGSIIPTGPEVQYVGEKRDDELIIFIYKGKDASFSLYEDDGTTYAYEKGGYTEIGFDYDEEKGILTIAERKGQYEGMLKSRSFIIKVIDADHPLPMEFDRKGIRIRYSGKAITKKI